MSDTVESVRLLAPMDCHLDITPGRDCREGISAALHMDRITLQCAPLHVADIRRILADLGGTHSKQDQHSGPEQEHSQQVSLVSLSALYLSAQISPMLLVCLDLTGPREHVHQLQPG